MSATGCRLYKIYFEDGLGKLRLLKVHVELDTRERAFQRDADLARLSLAARHPAAGGEVVNPTRYIMIDHPCTFAEADWIFKTQASLL